MTVSELQLSNWAAALSETEEKKCQSAIRQISEAIRGRFGNEVSIYLQGSHKNRTNIRLNSDVDIVICHTNHYFPGLSGISESDKQTFNRSFVPSTYTFGQFKNEIEEVLRETFFSFEIERKNKCIRVKGNTYRVNADVIPCFVHRRYRTAASIECEGIQLITDTGENVISFPLQHYSNGVSKNDLTSRKYKEIVRILKNIRSALIEDGSISTDEMSSFFLECLVWNVMPNHLFRNVSYYNILRSVIGTIWNDMLIEEKSHNYAEVSDLRWLFRGSTERSPGKAKKFLDLASIHVGYQN